MRAVHLLPLLLFLSAVSCSSVQTPQDPSHPPPPQTTLAVRNEKPVDFNLYVLNGTTRIRLGLVPGMSSRTFTVPHHLIPVHGPLRFQAATIGSDDVLGSDEDLMVHEGDALSLTIR
ncbi:MAG: hypothetical protein ACJ8AT_17295 [Hyalangium sp.]|uniref:hypothetical protein n=1 Tax=Hyalangium sp. TaxID=2028555 RepID=UPI00389A7469